MSLEEKLETLEDNDQGGGAGNASQQLQVELVGPAASHPHQQWVCSTQTQRHSAR